MKLAAAPAIRGDEYLTLARALAPFFEHTIACNGLNVLVSHCDDADQARLHAALDKERAQSLLLTDYRAR